MPPRDEFDDPEGFFSRLVTHTGRRAGSVFENRSLVISGVVFVSVVALSGVIWASYPSQNPLASDGVVPIIRADAEPYKYAPEDRGGMPIPHQDSTIFSALRPNAEGRKVENLLADDEQPMDRQQLFAGLKTDLAAATDAAAASAAPSNDDVKLAGMSGDYANQRPLSESERRAEAARRNREALTQEAAPLPGDVDDNSSKLPGVLRNEEIKPDPSAATAATPSADDLADDAAPAEATPAAPVVTATPPEKAETTAPVVAEQPKKEDASKSTAAATPAKAPTTGAGNTYVQVASVQDEAKVKPEWKKLVATLPMLTGLDYRVQRADLGAKGVYHRIQVGPLSKEEATELCNAIKAKKPGGCLIAK